MSARVFAEIITRETEAEVGGKPCSGCREHSLTDHGLLEQSWMQQESRYQKQALFLPGQLFLAAGKPSALLQQDLSLGGFASP